MQIVQILVSFSLSLVITVLIVEGTIYNGFSNDLKQTVLDALAILIASIPIALPLVLNVNLALGAAFLAKNYHAIVTSIPALQDIASMSILCSDKTGTLTTAKMTILSENIYTSEEFSKDDVLLYAYLCSSTDKKDDSIDKAIVEAYTRSSLSNLKAEEYIQRELIGFNPLYKRVVSLVQRGDTYITIAKGLPAKIIDTKAGYIDDHEFQWKVIDDDSQIQSVVEAEQQLSKSGYKTIGVSICNGNARELSIAN